MLAKIYEQNPSEKELQRVVDALERDEIIIYPTDSVYAFGCSIRSAKAVERLRRTRQQVGCVHACKAERQEETIAGKIAAREIRDRPSAAWFIAEVDYLLEYIGADGSFFDLWRLLDLVGFER